LDVTETVAAGYAPASPVDGVSNARRFGAYSQLNKILDGSTTPIADTVVDLSFTLAGASTTKDLTAAPDAKDIADTVDLTGKKLVAILIVAASDNNAAGVTVVPGAVNGYDILGAAADRLTIYPGQTVCLFQLGATSSWDAVGAADKTIDFTGTLGDELDILAVFGTQ
jgi:hypothetical protein